MRKYVIGALIGATLTFGTQAFAEVSTMIGKAIQGSFPIKLDGKQLKDQAIVIDGTSYLPVRAIGDALNLDVSFNSDLGIELKKKGGTSVIVPPIPKEPTLKDIEQQIEVNKGQQEKFEKFISITNNDLSGPSDAAARAQKDLDQYQVELDKLKVELADLEKKKAELSK